MIRIPLNREAQMAATMYSAHSKVIASCENKKIVEVSKIRLEINLKTFLQNTPLLVFQLCHGLDIECSCM